MQCKMFVLQIRVTTIQHFHQLNNTLVLFPKLTVIIISFAHKGTRNNFSMKKSFFSSIYYLLTLRMSGLVYQVPISSRQSSLYLSFIDSFIDSITSKSIKLHWMLPVTVYTDFQVIAQLADSVMQMLQPHDSSELWPYQT